ncbi:MAG: cytochrome b, partial [Dokdonella sp.]
MANRLTQAVSGVQDWFNDRAPSFLPFYRKHMTEYYAPKNFNIWYIFGVL